MAENTEEIKSKSIPKLCWKCNHGMIFINMEIDGEVTSIEIKKCSNEDCRHQFMLYELIEKLSVKAVRKNPPMESDKVAIKIAEKIIPELTVHEQSFFVAGFQECIKWLKLHSTEYAKAWNDYFQTKGYKESISVMYKRGMVQPYIDNILRDAFDAGWNSKK